MRGKGNHLGLRGIQLRLMPELWLLWFLLCLVQKGFCENQPTAAGPCQSSISDSNRLENLRAQLIGAVASNLTEQVIAVLKAEPSLSRTTNQPWESSLLIQCARHENPELVKAFIDAGAPPNPPGDDSPLGITLRPFFNSWGWGNKPPPESRDARLQLAGYLLSKGASIFGDTGYSRSVIASAYDSGNGEMVDFLLTNQVNSAVCDKGGNTLVHLAAVWGRTNALRELALRKLDLERTNNAGHTPLQTVARIPAPTRFDGGAMRPSPALHAEGVRHRDDTFALLLELGVEPDILSYIALGRTNDVFAMLTSAPQSVRACDGAGAAALHWAVQFGNPVIARTLVTNGAALEVTNAQGQTPLDLAATIGHIEVTKLLVESGATFNRSPGTKTPLHSAAERGFLDLVEYFVGKGADPEAECDGKQTPLDLAARANHDTVVRFLIARHAKLKTGGDGVTTPLHWAVAHGNTNLITFLLNRGCDIRALNAEGRPAIHLAQAENNFELIEFLLTNGADINERDTNGNTALHLRVTAEKDVFPAPPTASWRWSEKLKSKAWAKKYMPPEVFVKPPTRSMMRFLIGHGADVGATNNLGQTALHAANAKWFAGTNAAQDAEQWLKPLWAGGCQANVRDGRGLTALHLATSVFNGAVIQSLIRHGARPDAQDAEGNTPLHIAAHIDHPDSRHYVEDEEKARLFEMLIKAGAKPELKNKTGATALHLVASLDIDDLSVRMTELLLRQKSPINSRDLHGHTPLHIASTNQSGASGVASFVGNLPGNTNGGEWWFATFDDNWEDKQRIPHLLIQAGADLNAVDEQGNTPLHLAVMECVPPIVALLAESGANRKVRNAAGKTAIEVAYDVAPGFTVIPFLQPPGASSEIADAARCGDYAGVKAFLEDNPGYANRAWVYDTTPLQWACNEGHFRVAELLIHYGANVNPAVDYDAYSDITNTINKWQVAKGEAQRRAWLPLDFLTPKSRQDQRDSPHESIPAEPALRPLGQLGTDTTLTPLQLALVGGFTNIAALLVDHGAHLDPVSAVLLERTDYLVGVAETNRNSLNRRYLVGSWNWRWDNEGYCGIWSSTNEYSGPLLHHAVRAGRLNSAHALLDLDADMFAQDYLGKTAYELAIQSGNTNMRLLFENNGTRFHPSPLR